VAPNQVAANEDVPSTCEQPHHGALRPFPCYLLFPGFNPSGAAAFSADVALCVQCFELFAAIDCHLISRQPCCQQALDLEIQSSRPLQAERQSTCFSRGCSHFHRSDRCRGGSPSRSPAASSNAFSTHCRICYFSAAGLLKRDSPRPPPLLRVLLQQDLFVSLPGPLADLFS
jgi:hypothetical protein